MVHQPKHKERALGKFSIKNFVEDNTSELRWRKTMSIILLLFAVAILGLVLYTYVPIKSIVQTIDSNFPWLVLTGFLAQLVDGALGMGYGVTSSAVLLGVGVSPASISGAVHTAEVFSSAASGYSHFKLKNVNKVLFKRLVIPGTIGAIIGSALLYYFDNKDAAWLRTALACYTLFLGIKFFINAFKDKIKPKKFKHYRKLAAVGGFLDAFGGGGWGPLVTATLIDQGRNPKYVIGSVSLTEFFITFASAFTFFVTLGLRHLQIVVALVIGGLVAAPIAARLAGKLNQKTSFICLGILVCIWSVRILLK